MPFAPFHTPHIPNLPKTPALSFRLFHAPLGLRSMSARLIVAETAADFAMVPVQRYTDSEDESVVPVTASAVPLQRLPALVVTGSETATLYDIGEMGNAVRRAGSRNGQLPADTSDVSLMCSLELLVAKVIHPAMEMLERGHPDPHKQRALREELSEGFRAMTKILGESASVGARLTVADAIVAPYVLACLRLRPHLEDMPWRLMRYGVQLAAHESVQEDTRWAARSFLTEADTVQEMTLHLARELSDRRTNHQPACVVRGGQVFAASAPDGPALYTCSGHDVFNGATTVGAPVAAVADGHVYAGSAHTGVLIARVAHGRLYTLDNNDRPIATLHGGTDCQAAAVALVLLGVEPKLTWPH